MNTPFRRFLTFIAPASIAVAQALAGPGISAIGPGGSPPTPVQPGGTGRMMQSLVSGNPIDTADQATAQITALATALGNDPLRIYEWVVNNVEYEPYFGLRRGAQMTLLDRSGNDWDQSALLGALLKAAGFSPTYQYGYSQMPWSAATNYFGMSQAQAFNYLNALGLWPTNNGSTVTFARLWVTATINGQAVVFDPSFKQSPSQR